MLCKTCLQLYSSCTNLMKASLCRIIPSQFSSSANLTVAMEREIGKFARTQSLKLKLDADSPEDSRLLRFAIIGNPNSGKSTLTNKLVKWKMSSASAKVHTTRKNVLGILTEDNTQIVFIDTPGIIPLEAARKIKLQKSMLLDPHSSILQADMVGVIVDVSDRYGISALNKEILKVLYLNPAVPAILILNKVDLMDDKENLLSIVRALTNGIVRSKRTSTPMVKLKENLSPLQMMQKIERESTNKQCHEHNHEQRHEHNHELHEHDNVQRYVHNHGALYEHNHEQHHDEHKYEEHKPKLPVNIGSKTPNYYLQWLSNKYSNTRQHLVDPGEKRKIRQLNEVVRDMKGWDSFAEIFMISALDGDGVTYLRDYLIKSAKRCNWLYHSSVVTNQSPISLTKQLITEKLLDHLPHHIPYTLKLDVISWDVDETSGLINVIVDVLCPSNHHMKHVLGPNGSTITKIASEAKQELLNAFRTDIVFKLQAKLIEKHP